MKSSFKSNILPDKNEVKKLQKESLINMNKYNSEFIKEKKKKIILITSIIITIILIIKIFIGTIEIPNIFGYSPRNIRFYKVTVNNEVTQAGYELTHKFPIIPFLVNINSYHMGVSHIKDDLDGPEYFPDNSKKFLIDISSYECYANNFKVECRNDQQEMKEVKDTKYTHLKITRTNNPYEIVYDGKYINDITKYVEKKGVYAVSITAEHGLVETNVYFYFVRK